MIRVNVSEAFPITSTIFDDQNNQISGETIQYEICYLDDSPLVPPNTGTFLESTTASGIYIANIVVNIPGNFLCYVTCSGYPTSVKELVVEEKTVADHIWEHNKAQELVNNIGFIKAIESGAWKIVNNRMIFLAEDNVTETAVFDLFDKYETQAEYNIYERRRVLTFCYNCILDETGDIILDELGNYLLDES